MQDVAGKIVEAAPEGVPWVLIIAIVLVAAGVSWAITEPMKRLIRTTNEEEPRWEPLTIRSFAVLLGFGIGAFIGGVGWHWEYGAMLGALGGALNTFIVWTVKKYAARRLGSEQKKDGGTESL